MFSSSVLLELLILALTCGKLDAQALKLNLPAAEVFDLRYPLIIDRNNASSGSRTAFGFSVALSAGPSQSTERSFKTGWIFIGDPLDDPPAHDVKETGAIWRCSLGKRSEQDFCQKVDMDPKPGNKRRDNASPQAEDEGESWIGGDIQVKNGRLVTCGHRYTRGGRSYMNGICYLLPDSEVGPQAERSFHKPRITPVINGDYSHRLMPMMALKTSGGAIDPLTEGNFNYTLNGKSDIGNEWGLGQVGISIELLKNSTNGQELLLGAPGVRMWSGAVVRYLDNPTQSDAQNLRLNRFQKNDPSFAEMVVAYRGSLTNSENNHWHDYFGYEVSSGRYFNSSEVLYSAGAPRAADLTGEVVIFSIPHGPPGSVKRDIEVKAEIRPTSQAFGSYFGSVLLSVDLDGDGRDELLVGAPMFTATKRKPVKRSADLLTKDPNEINFSAPEDKTKEPEWTGDHGCVFVYWFHENSSVAQQQNLTGGDSPIPGGRFGSAISFLNFSIKDSSPELFIVVGAPYERDGRGAIYLYKMNRTANELKFSHKITSEEVSGGAVIQGFGNFISLSADIDGNDTPDLAIGAFKSNKAIVLRSRPRVKLHGKLGKDGVTTREIVQAGEKYSFEICTSYEIATGVSSRALEIWTEIEVDIRLSIEIGLISFNQHIERNSEQLSGDKRRLVYKSKSNNLCQWIHTFLNPNVRSTATSELPLPIKISQTVWYNQTEDSTAKPLTYEIDGELKSPVRTKSSFNYASFEDNKPFPVPQTVFHHTFEVTPNNCNNASDCKFDLDLNYSWYDANDKTLSNPLSSYTIGTFDVVLLLTISNKLETAQKPRYDFRWDNEAITLADDKINNEWIDECKSEAKRMKYTCTLMKNVMQNHTVARKFKFDMSKVFARKESDIFKVYIRFENNGTTDKYKLKDAELKLNILKETSVRIIGSRMSDTLKNAFVYNCTKLHFPRESDGSTLGKNDEEMKLYSKFRQTYRITLSGTRVQTVQIKVKLPRGYSLKEEEKSLLLIEQPVGKSNVQCDAVDHSYFYNIRPPGEPSRDNSVEEESNIFSTVANRRRRQVEDVESSEHDSSISQEDEEIHSDVNNANTSDFRVKQIDYEVQESTLHIKCDDSSTIGYKWKCFELTCNVHNVSSYEEIHFDMYFVQESIDQLMRELGKTQVLVQSSGSVEIDFPKIQGRSYSHQFDHADIAQTKLEKVVGEVENWVYLVAILSGILLLLLLVFILYKCGFFKREQKAKLDGMKRDIARKSSMFPPNLRSGSYMEMIEQPDDDPEPPAQTKKNSLGEVVEHM